MASTANTIRSLRQKARIKLASSTNQSVTQTPSLDVDCILSFVLGISRTQLLSHDNTLITSEQMASFSDALSRRLSGLPIAYITGHKEFYGYDFVVTPDVLIPKADTELLVERAISYVRKQYSTRNNHNSSSPNTKKLRIADVCTGSGCIALSLLLSLSELPLFPLECLEVTASDISSEALEVAKQNADRFFEPPIRNLITLTQADLLQGVPPQSFDLILSNPPYVPARITDKLLLDGRSEPRIALDGDMNIDGTENEIGDGLSIIRRLIPQAFEALAEGGVFMLETGEYNAPEAMHILEESGFIEVQNIKDIAGQMRLTCAKKL